MSGRPKLLLIDGYHTFFRAFYAIRELANSRGLPTNAVYGFIQILRKVLTDEAPDLVGVALDVSDETVRRARYSEYKANRAPMPADLAVQIPFLRRAIEGFRIPILELDPYEADDVMGTLSKRAAAAGYDVVLVSADKDLMQLVGPHVTMFHTGRNKRYDPAQVEADYGLPPERIADYLALVGDAVDNVPGVPGIGDKGAQKLVAEYGSVEVLLERAGEVSRKAYREGLENHREQALLSKELVTIHTDLPVELHPESLRLDPPDTEALRALYTELEFRGLLEELGGSAAAAGAALEATEIVEPAAVGAALAAVEGRFHVALAGGEAPAAVAFAGAGGGAARWLDLRRDGMHQSAGEAFGARCGEAARELAGHDLKEVLRLVPGGERSRCALRDLQLASYLLRSSAHGHSLEEIAAERLGAQPRSGREAGFQKGQEPPLGDERLGAWACERLGFALQLDALLFDELETTGRLADIYREIEAPLLPVLVSMEEAGIALDVPYLAAMSKEMAAEVVGLEAAIHEAAGEAFNLNSPQQLGAILFDKLGLPVLRKTRKTKSWSTDAATLEELARRGHELPQQLLRYREVSKLKSTYVDALPQLVAADGRVHTRFQQAVAATGRLSSVNPNLQNIPVRTDQGQLIRKAFVAAPGNLLLVVDYSQIELRILAHIAAEPAMIEAFRTGQDIHRTTAASVLGVAPDLVSGDQRRAAKTINFGLIYGMSAFGLGQALGVSTNEAEAFMKAYFARYGGVQAYMQETMAMAERDGRVETLWGRVRHLPELTSSNWNLRENARRVAINARIQGTAADVLKLAMIAVDRRLRAEHPDAQAAADGPRRARPRGAGGGGRSGGRARPRRDGVGRAARRAAGRGGGVGSHLVRRQGVNGGFDSPRSNSIGSAAVNRRPGPPAPLAALLLAAALGLGAAPAWAGAAYSFYGTTASGPTFDRPTADGLGLSGQVVSYGVQPFFVDAEATCAIYGVQEGTFDGMIFLYGGSFDPTKPLINLRGQSDDADLGAGSSALVGVTLEDDKSYYLVTAAKSPGTSGNFSTFVACSGATRVLAGDGSMPSYDGRYGEVAGGRFRISATWRDFQGGTGDGRFVPLGSQDSGVLWFFSPSNFEVMIKVLDACSFNNRFWVFYSAVTSVEFEITVTDTFTSTTRQYQNSLGVSAPAVTDTDAFETCP